MKKNLQTTFSTRQKMLEPDFEIYYYEDTSQDFHYANVNPHTHNYYEFYIFLEGHISMDIEGVSHPLVPGDVLIIPPNTKHYAKLLDNSIPYRRFVFWISQDYCNKLFNISSDYVYLIQRVHTTKQYLYHYDIIGFNTLQSKIFRLIEETHANRFGKQAKVQLCLKDLVFHFNRSIYEMEQKNKKYEENALYENILLYIEDHIDEDLTLDHLSEIFFVSKYHISHVFKANLGISVHQFITKKRLRLCKDAISYHTNLTEICILYGFKDYTSFFRAFKKEFGMSPKEFKELSVKTQEKQG